MRKIELSGASVDEARRHLEVRWLMWASAVLVLVTMRWMWSDPVSAAGAVVMVGACVARALASGRWLDDPAWRPNYGRVGRITGAAFWVAAALMTAGMILDALTGLVR